jgi:microsomal dipeptidase-like Zn-dependent dipeptidase
MSAEAHAGGARFQEAVVVDAHVHTTDYLPDFATSVYRWATRRTVPPLFFLDQLASAGVDAVVANAVGDRAATAWWGRPPWRAVEEQLRRIRVQAERAHVVLATSAVQVQQAFDAGRMAIVLGLEGGDGIGMHLSRVDELFRWGVRPLPLTSRTSVIRCPVRWRVLRIGHDAVCEP